MSKHLIVKVVLFITIIVVEICVCSGHLEC